MKVQCGIVVAGAAQAYAAAYPRSTYEYTRPVVSSKPLQDLITTEG
jgi:hypothetical protein